MKRTIAWTFAWWFGISVCLLAMGGCESDVCGKIIPCGIRCPCR